MLVAIHNNDYETSFNMVIYGAQIWPFPTRAPPIIAKITYN